MEFVKRNYDVFALAQDDVLGIDSQVVIHNLFTDLDHPPVRQKRMKFTPERLKVIEEEVAKLIKANIIKESHYPNWLANVVVSPQKEESGACVSILPT